VWRLGTWKLEILFIEKNMLFERDKTVSRLGNIEYTETVTKITMAAWYILMHGKS
jgi:hypothetical protein